VGRVRLLVGCGAIAATIPYLLLKLHWILGGTVGMVDPARLQNATYFYANIVTFGMDLVAVVIALACTSAWGLRIPAALVLLPTWLATGFLLPIVVLLPLVAATSNWPTQHDDALAAWVYGLVYTGFAVQGVLLLAAFALYTRARWAAVFGRMRTAPVPSPPAPRGALLVAALGMAAGLVGVAHLIWAMGGTVGMSVAYAAQHRAIDHLAHGVYGVFACLAAVGVPVFVVGVRWSTWMWVPLVVGWAGTGSMVAWGSWLLLTAVVQTAAAPGYVGVLLLEVGSAAVLARVSVGVFARRLRNMRTHVEP
jgi:hypothetical protein